MANSTTTLDTIQTSQAGKEITANQLFDAMSTAAIFGRRGSTTSALTWGYYGGAMEVSGTPTQIANGTIALTASSTNYIEAVIATGVVAKNVIGWTSSATHIPLYEIVTGTAGVTSYQDFRSMKGNKGEVGNTGAAGGTMLTGSGAPSGGLGSNGDLYLNTANGDYYQKVTGSWGSALLNVIGAAGAAGSATLTGSGAPSGGLGSNGDIYVNTANGDYYKKVTGSWGSPLLNIIGPAGADTALHSVQATLPSTLAVLTGNIRWYPRASITLTNVFVSMGTAIFSGSKPTVASGANTSGANAISVALTSSDYLTIDVETASGGDAIVRIDYT
jgi:hypothetical protein